MAAVFGKIPERDCTACGKSYMPRGALQRRCNLDSCILANGEHYRNTQRTSAAGILKRCVECGETAESFNRKENLRCARCVDLDVPTHTFWCTKCRTRLPESAFQRSALKRFQNKCRECTRWAYIWRTYRLTQEAFYALLAKQGNCCAVCLSDTPSPHGKGGWLWCVDHDHACCPGKKSCGKCVRGILCGSCNNLLGVARDDIQRLVGAVNYLLQTSVREAEILVTTVVFDDEPDRLEEHYSLTWLKPAAEDVAA